MQPTDPSASRTRPRSHRGLVALIMPQSHSTNAAHSRGRSVGEYGELCSHG